MFETFAAQEPQFDTFLFKKDFVFNMFLQQYKATMEIRDAVLDIKETLRPLREMQETLRRLDKKVAQLEKREEYGVANVVELSDSIDLIEVPLQGPGGIPNSGPKIQAGIRGIGEIQKIKNLETSQNDILIEGKASKSKNKKEFKQKQILSAEDLEDAKFRFHSQKALMTYSQSGEDLTLDMVYNDIHSKYPIERACMCYELHQDGGKHIHAYIEFVEKLDVKGNPRLFDLYGIHPNIRKKEGYLEVRNAINYVFKKQIGKEEGWIKQWNMDWKMDDSFRKAHCKMLLADIVNRKITLAEGCMQMHNYALRYQQYQKNLEMFWKAVDSEDRVQVPLREWKMWGKDIFWDGKRKCKQFWIFGDTDVGKTWFRETYLEKELGCSGYEIPVDNDDHYWADKMYDFAFIDEFNGNRTIQFLNKFLEGVDQYMNNKGSSVWKRKNVPVFLLSNKMPHNVYRNVAQNEPNVFIPFLNRLRVFWVTSQKECKEVDMEQYMKIIKSLTQRAQDRYPDLFDFELPIL
jgi:hypothetical protein